MTMTDIEIIEAVKDSVYFRMLELGFSTEEIALMPRDVLQIWVTAILKP
jgi:hypothetical protein